MPRHVAAAALALALVLPLVGCTGEDPGQKPGDPSTSEAPNDAGPGSGSTDDGSSDGAPALPAVRHPVSLPALMTQEYDGRALRLHDELASTASYRQFSVTWRSGNLRISGVLDVPRGRGPFPAVVLAHGYIDPAFYDHGQGMRRELDWLGNAGFVTLHVDYRNHAFSDDDPTADRRLRLGYTEDVIDAVLALRRWRGPVDDERIGLVGRSMGGGVVYNVLTVQPGLVDAAVVFAPVSSNSVDNFERWIRPNPARSGLAGDILRRYGEPATHRAFWRGVSPRTYFDRVTEPVLIHHGTSDDSCPIAWSRQTARAMRAVGVDVTLREYAGEEHAFGPQWPLSMGRTEAFLRRHLR
jgi:dipeptidyl aminopeptidase/acylaminoacyl peptidase